MEKKENNGDKIKKLIQALVQEELKKFSKDIAKIIKEQVQAQVKIQVNEILAEQFLKNISNNNSLNSVFSEQTTQKSPPKLVNKQQAEAEKNQIKEAYQRKLKKLGVHGTEAAELFEGMDLRSITSASPGAVSNPFESDDEGVDLSKFGY